MSFKVFGRDIYPNFDLASVGMSYGPSSQHLVIAVHYPDEVAAAANAAALDDLLRHGTMLLNGVPWSSVLTVDSVTTQGTTVVAVTTSRDPMFMARELRSGLEHGLTRIRAS